MDGELITTAQAADLLGVRTATIYSYVSRGLLKPAGDSRSRHDGSVFHQEDVVAMVEARRRPKRGHIELTIETAVTSVEPSGVLLYRGIDAAELARTQPFEAVAEIVWGGAAGTNWPHASPADPDPTLTPRDLIHRAVWDSSIADPDRNSLSPDHFRDSGRRAIRAAAAHLSAARGRETDSRTAQLVLNGVATKSPKPGTAEALDVALGLLADHELATSTLAARAAASTGADPYAVMTAGLAALGGIRHGSASAAAYDLLEAAMSGVVRLPVPTPGFGHSVYTDTDPRAAVLLDLVATLDEHVTNAVDGLALQVRRAAGLAPNVDLGLAALALACQLPRHTGEVVFTIARLAGFVAHGIEEQGHPLRFRARATYTGKPRRPGTGPT